MTKGYLKERHGMMMLPAIPREGQCIECREFHSSEQPHNRDALRYQYTFYDVHGRWPTWADAMKHCAADLKADWKRELELRGVKINEVPEVGCMNISVKFGE